MAKSLADQQRDLVLVQLEHVTEAIARIEAQLATVTVDLGQVRLEEMRSVRAELAELKSDLKVLQFQAKRSGAFAGAWISAVISVAVAAAAALLLKHP